LFVIFYFKENIVNTTLYLFNNAKNYISSYYTNITTNITNHFNQIQKIEKLNKENKKYRDYIAKLQPKLHKAEQLKYFKNLNIPNITFSQTISYAKIPDLTTIYIDYNKTISSPKGLIYNNTAAGIVTKNYKNFSIAILNDNPKTTYTVFIGDYKVPGVLFGGKEITIKYIPKYHKININDLVITSGLDTIFYEGVEVGKITKITQKKLYQEAVIEPFFDPLHPTFFYVCN